MRRYPESNLKGKIASARKHPTVPNVTILKVCVEEQGPKEQVAHIFDSLIPPESLKGLHLRADALTFPPARNSIEDDYSLLAMEWCFYNENGDTVKCSPGWSEHEEPTQHIQIAPSQQ